MNKTVNKHKHVAEKTLKWAIRLEDLSSALLDRERFYLLVSISFSYGSTAIRAISTSFKPRV